MNIRSVRQGAIRSSAHDCAGSVWTYAYDQRGSGRSVFCEARAHGGKACGLVQASIQRHLTEQLRDWRQRKFPRWVWVNPRADAFLESSRDLGASTEAVISTLATRRIGALIHTRGGMPAGRRLVHVGRRFPDLLRVGLGFFSGRDSIADRWERGSSSLRARIDLLAELNRFGVDTGVRLGPLLPHVNDTLDDWAPILEQLSDVGVTEVTPFWTKPSRRLLSQIRREISMDAADAIDSMFNGGDDLRTMHWQVATLNRMRSCARSLGIVVKRCRCGPERSAKAACLIGPRKAREARQLALFA